MTTHDGDWREGLTDDAIAELDRLAATIRELHEKLPLSPNDMARLYRAAPPIVMTAVSAILRRWDAIDPMGYDLAYYLEDLPRVVAEAIEPWRGM